MHAQVLTTKLFAPPHRAGLVPRPRLIERLDAGTQRKLTLLSAPAGFGKTTLVSEWVAARGRPAAWLSLDPADRDPERFLLHLAAALQTVDPALGNGVLSALDAPHPPPTAWLLTELLNDVAAAPDAIVLVLDDYHAVDAEAIDDALAFLLDHLPPQLHLAITTREDPNLRLAGLRAGDQLTELRAAELRFTPEEAAEFLNGVMGLDLSAEDIASLDARTEGWIAGLQLAALSMRGRDDAPAFVRAFAGDHRYIVDYLVEEVLRRQPERVRSFLLDTSVLDRLNGSLCDAVTGQEGCAALLDTLERGNLFLVPLDDRRRWYRYHHLFADVLDAHAKHAQPERLPILHARASAWFEAHDATAGAVQHALAGGDVERAARLIEAAWRAMDSTFQSAVWLGWAQSLPEELVRSRPVLCAGCAWAHLNAGELEAAEGRLRDAERWLEAAGAAGGWPHGRATGGIVGPEEEVRALPGTVASARAYHALAARDPGASVSHAQRALELLPAHDHVGRGVPLGILSLAHWANGDLEDAYRILSQAMAGFRASGSVVAGISGAFGLADILLARGRLREAARTYEEALLLAAGSDDPAMPGMAELHVGLGDVRREQGDLEAAERHRRQAEALGERAVLPGDEARLRAAMARLEAGLGSLERALALLDEADGLRIRSPMPDLRPVAAWRARIWVEQGRVAEARAWVRERALSTEDAPRYLGEFEHLVLARVLLGEARKDRNPDAAREATLLLERLLEAAEEGDRAGSAIEILALLALAYQARGDTRAAVQRLARALFLAEPEGYVRTFLDEGLPMAALLREVERTGVTTAYARRLLDGFQNGGARPAGAQSSIDDLTEREGEVLRLLGTDLSGPEIARELRVSLNTMRTHVKNVYSKLGVNSRRTAVRRARELDLL